MALHWNRVLLLKKELERKKKGHTGSFLLELSIYKFSDKVIVIILNPSKKGVKEQEQMIEIPLDIPKDKRDVFLAQRNCITRNSNNLFLLAFDHGIEHLDQTDPETVFRLATRDVGALAAPLELIARYGGAFRSIPYIVKISGKTNLVPLDTQEPRSQLLYSIQDVVSFARTSELLIAGVGITIYPGSLFEEEMLHAAAQTILQAHQQGLLAILWVYPRGKVIPDETDTDLLAGIAALANNLGADFVKIKLPKRVADDFLFEQCEQIVAAAGKSRLIFSGGENQSDELFISRLQISLKAGFAGCAVGRNLFQRPFLQAEKLRYEIAKQVYRVIE